MNSKVREKSRIVLVMGLEGRGKSCLCQSIVHCWAHGKKFQDDTCLEYSLPVLVELSRLGEDEDLEQKIFDFLHACRAGAEDAQDKEVTAEIIRAYGSDLILILDGIDQTPLNQKQNVKKLLDKIYEKDDGSVFRHASVLVTAKPGSDAQKLVFDSIYTIMKAPWTSRIAGEVRRMYGCGEGWMHPLEFDNVICLQQENFSLPLEPDPRNASYELEKTLSPSVLSKIVSHGVMDASKRIVDRIVLVRGLEGRGKSCLCQSIVHCWAQGKNQFGDTCVEYSLPVLVEVSRLREDEDLEQKIFAFLHSCRAGEEDAEDKEVTAEIIRAYGSDLVLILDGIDKTPLNQKQNVKKLLDKIHEKDDASVFRHASVLVTAKPGSDAQKLVFDRIYTIMKAPWTSRIAGEVRRMYGCGEGWMHPLEFDNVICLQQENFSLPLEPDPRNARYELEKTLTPSVLGKIVCQGVIDARKRKIGWIVLVRGLEGSGKSCFCQSIVHCWEHGKNFFGDTCLEYSLPVLVELDRLGKDEDLELKIFTFLHSCRVGEEDAEDKEVTAEIIRAYGSDLVLILDGIDQTPLNQKQNVEKLLVKIHDTDDGSVFSHASVLVTAKPGPDAQTLVFDSVYTIMKGPRTSRLGGNVRQLYRNEEGWMHPLKFDEIVSFQKPNFHVPLELDSDNASYKEEKRIDSKSIMKMVFNFNGQSGWQQIRSVLVRGLAGRGKSCLCQRIVHCWAHGKSPLEFLPPEDILPVLFELRYLGQEEDLEQRIFDFLHACRGGELDAEDRDATAEAILTYRSGLVLIFDGFDELPSNQKENIKTFLVNIRKEDSNSAFRHASVLVTSKPDTDMKSSFFDKAYTVMKGPWTSAIAGKVRELYENGEEWIHPLTFDGLSSPQLENVRFPLVPDPQNVAFKVEHGMDPNAIMPGLFDYHHKTENVEVGLVLVNGLAGRGKSYLCQNIVRCWARGIDSINSKPHEDILPVLFELRHLREDEDLEEKIFEFLHACRAGEENAEDKNATADIIVAYGNDLFLILDGFDELLSNRKENVKNILDKKRKREGNSIFRDATVLVTAKPGSELSTSIFEKTYTIIKGPWTSGIADKIRHLYTSEDDWMHPLKIDEAVRKQQENLCVPLEPDPQNVLYEVEHGMETSVIMREMFNWDQKTARQRLKLVLVRGLAGRGKTCLCQCLVHCWAREKTLIRALPHGEILPVLFELRHLGENEDLGERISDFLHACRAGEEGAEDREETAEIILAHGRSLVLILDGFDQVPITQRDNVKMFLSGKGNDNTESVFRHASVLVTTKPSTDVETLDFKKRYTINKNKARNLLSEIYPFVKILVENFK